MTKINRAQASPKAYPSSKYIFPAATAAVAAVLYWFWAFPYRAALSYREQLQLFQSTDTYFHNLAERPGGIATYTGEFLTQFFNNYWIGAAVMTGLMLIFFLLCYAVNNKFSPFASKSVKLSLALFPLSGLMLCFGNPGILVSFIVALSISIGGAYLFTTSKTYPIMLAAIILHYWMTGPVTAVYALLIIAYLCKDNRKSKSHKAVFALATISWLAANVWLWSYFLPYPLSYQLMGIGYTMFPDTLLVSPLLVEFTCVATPFAAVLLANAPKKTAIPAILGVAIIAVAIIYPKAYDKVTYRLIDYDYMVRANDLEGIIQYSNVHDPDLPLSVSATNLALGMTGQLDSRAFAYFQNGVEGLIPPFSKETLSSWTTGEIFFQLGMINSAQRFYFEGMEAITNYNKSSRAIKRLAETAMIRGDYAVAEKYLHLLENTLFYRKWAQRNLALIKEPNGVDNHPLYGRLRARMVDGDYLFSEGELDKTLGQLFLKDPNNNLAKQYLIVYPLLQRDLNKFTQYMGVVAESQPQYNPPLAQQVMAFMAMKNGQRVPPGAVAPGVEQSLRDFAQAWTSKDQARLEPYRRSLYNYLLSNE